MSKDKDCQYWDIGDEKVFRPTKDKCQKLVMAILLCSGKILDTFSLDVSFDSPGQLIDDLKPHQIAMLIRIKLPKGQKELFEEIMGYECLEEPPQFHTNHMTDEL